MYISTESVAKVLIESICSLSPSKEKYQDTIDSTNQSTPIFLFYFLPVISLMLQEMAVSLCGIRVE
ncbi:MAG: hypothetical protein ACXVP0_09690, partial [Bacteroidia bacterium]